MSADYWLEIDTGGGEPGAITETRNVTYNLGPMLRAAGFPDWKLLIGTPASEAAGMLDGVLRKMEADRERLVAEHTPSNGWGDWSGGCDFVRELRDDCAANPKAMIGGWL
jgi:hypothetical protein